MSAESPRALVVAVGLAASLTACTPEQPAPVELPPISFEIAPPASSSPREASLPDIACSSYTYGNEYDRASADTCKRLQQGRVALITFDIPPELTQAIATGMTESIDTATAGTVKPAVTVLEASPKTKELFNERVNERGCVNSARPKEYGSSIADETMALDEFDFVMALSDTRSCNGRTAGVTHSAPGRYAEVFLGTVGGGIRLDVPLESTSLDELAIATATHEFGHQQGLGHSGDIYCPSDGGAGNIVALNTLKVQPLPNRFDLQAHLSSPGCEYEEYGSKDIMGASTGRTTPPSINPNRLQIDHLKKMADPERKLAFGRSITEEWTTIDSEAASDGFAYTITKLPTPITYPGKEDSAQFEEIAFVPYILPHHETGEPRIGGVRVSLLRDGGETLADLGILALTDEKTAPASWVVMLGGKNIEINLSSQSIQTRLVS